MPSAARTALRLSDVWKTFDGVTALKGVSFDVRAGEVHALLGENGAGKSTLMSVAAGSLIPDAGVVEIEGSTMDVPSPGAAQALGLGVVYQHPAVLSDLSVAENLALSMPPGQRPPYKERRAWAHEALERVGGGIDPGMPAGDLSAAQMQLVEIARALVLEPRVLILDEPTAALTSAEVERLFDQIRAIQAGGTAVVYISHRIPEITEIADRVTVLRDGEVRGTFEIAAVSEQDILKLIVGREVSAIFPGKGAASEGSLLYARNLLGGGEDHELVVRPGEIVGFAGVEGNGQRETLRELAGLGGRTVDVTIAGEDVTLRSPREAQQAGVLYVPGDRQRDGIFGSLSVRVNAAASALESWSRLGFVHRLAERAAVDSELQRTATKTATMDAPVTALSGGNQQKVVFARALLAKPRVLLCEEPTQGVDAGARIEIYKLLRDLAEGGVAVLVLSSDAIELEGLCDRVLIFSRGAVVAELAGDQVTEEAITGAAITSTTARRATTSGPASRRGFERFLRGDQAPAVVLALIMLGLGIYTANSNPAYLTSLNFESLLFLATALVFVSLGQLVVLLTGGIDLSVGPVVGLTVIMLSDLATDAGNPGRLVLALLVIVGLGVAVGVINALLIRKASIPPLIATLATFICLQGIALLLRPRPEGIIDITLLDTFKTAVGPVPIAFVGAIVIALLAQVVLRRTRFGNALRAIGSNEQSAHRIGVRVTPTIVAAYVACALFAVLGGLMLAMQVGIGDPTVGQNYTLTSITAVVLGGASIYGGRGSFVATLLGALLITQIINALTFLNLSEAWQYWLPGVLILVAAGVYSHARGVRIAALEQAA
ncbi:MAG: ribose transport system permease protein rbsA [Thermoleophilaceae bacterium]|nr:ribose transport system permease protein rbsA [Thermoleophilaceae bacterium]